MDHCEACASFCAAGIFALLFSLPAAAQLPPQGFTADPSTPSIADWTYTNSHYTVHRCYYYDCLNAKWTLAPLGGDAPESTPPKLGSTVASGPPPGSERSLSEPDHAFNPTTGENYHYDGDNKQWVNSKTRKAFPLVNLCSPPTATTPPPRPPAPPSGTTVPGDVPLPVFNTPPRKNKSTLENILRSVSNGVGAGVGGVATGVGAVAAVVGGVAAGVGSGGGHRENHGGHHPHGTGYDPSDLPPTAKPAPQE